MPAPPPSPSLRHRTLLSVAKKRIIVTGGAGFIGRNLIAALNERGEENILIVDRLGDGEKWRNLIGLRFDDLADIDDFRRRVREDRTTPPSTLFHFGALDTNSSRDVDALVDNNYRFSRELCEWCLKHNGRLIYASSSTTYGDGSAGFFDYDELLPSLQPLDACGWSKHLFDLWALQSGYFSKIAGLKPFSVYGPHETHKGSGASEVFRFLQQIRTTGVATPPRSRRGDFGDGEQTRDFVHVRDVVAMTLFLHDRQDVCGLFNCGTGRSRSLNELVQLLFAAVGRETTVQYVDVAPERDGQVQYSSQADISKIRAAGFGEPLTSLEDGLRDYVRDVSFERQLEKK